MNMHKPTVVLCGVGYFERMLLYEIVEQWPVIVVEMDTKRIEDLKDEFESVRFLNADASSILTWKKIDLDEVGHVVSTFRDSDISLEIVRILRESMESKLPAIVLKYDDRPDDKFIEYGATLIKPLETSINIVLNKLNRNYSKAIDLGLKRGDIIELSILSKSHLTDRKMRTIRPNKWRIAAIYREDELVLPTPEEQLRVGDRVVFTGEPKVLENLANMLLQGTPQFPSQFGSRLGVALSSKWPDLVDEAVYLSKNVKTSGLNLYPVKKGLNKDLVGKVKEELENFSVADPVHSMNQILGKDPVDGLYVLPDRSETILRHFIMRDLFDTAQKPFLVSRGTFPYEEVVVSLNCDDPGYVMETGMELARELDVPLSVFYVAFPRELRGKEGNDALEKRDMIIEDFKSIYKLDIDYDIPEGNPVIESLNYIREKERSILVLGHDRKKPIGFFRPNVTYLVAMKCGMSALVLPTE
ncbi:NAD-binding protein [Limisalsivibrio acetivorans]|uniref:NAD-binding protein n=1 Tax=Limisalsivibrio acetivorans TaxID=1304888 RepID=UPI0003B53174|nr:NAD-binding protein [Limisalsivibrio acetivorans]